MIRAEVIEYMRATPDRELHVSMIAKAVRFSPRQVSGALSTLKNDDGVPQLALIRRGWWKWQEGTRGSRAVPPPQRGGSRPEPAVPPDELFEFIGCGSGGLRLLRSTSGEIGYFKPVGTSGV